MSYDKDLWIEVSVCSCCTWTDEWNSFLCPFHTQVLIIGAGLCGLRMAIECCLLGMRVVVVEMRDYISRNNVLHLWPLVISDLKALGAKIFYPKFCTGSLDHISMSLFKKINIYHSTKVTELYVIYHFLRLINSFKHFDDQIIEILNMNTISCSILMPTSLDLFIYSHSLFIYCCILI